MPTKKKKKLTRLKSSNPDDLPVTRKIVFKVRDELRSQIESVDNKIESVDKKVDSLDKKIDSVDKKVDSLESRIDSVDKKVDSLESRMDSVDKKVDSLDKKIDSLASEMRASNTRVEIMMEEQRHDNRVTLEHLSNLYLRQDRVEKNQEEMKETLKSLAKKAPRKKENDLEN